MTSLSYEQILTVAAPGSEFTPSRKLCISGTKIERPKKYWRSQGISWAVYTVSGSRLGETLVASVKHAKELGLSPLLIVRDNDELSAVAERYIDLQCHVACPIAGQGSLIPPISLPKTGSRRVHDKTRIPINILSELAGQPLFPAPLRRAIKRLHDKYRNFPSSGPHDEAERTALVNFMHSMLRQMGLRTTGNDSPISINRLERAGWGGRRDHFFHSFQNFFFGLYAICKLEPHFIKYREHAKIHWQIDSFHVWLLACLWHDVGYGTANLERIHEDAVWGDADAAEASAESTRLSFLESDDAREGLLCICALISRLIHPDSAHTELMMQPARMPVRNRDARNINRALKESVMHRGHGAPSALRLYCDFMPAVRRLTQEKQFVLTQVVLMASASLPFHDDNFRNSLRECHGPFTLSSEVVPFAVLLAFIDSIQDDRRDLSGISEEIRFLEEILVENPATVTARVNKDALHAKSVLWKTVEARDIMAHLTQSPAGLFFKYPDWMVAI